MTTHAILHRSILAIVLVLAALTGASGCSGQAPQPPGPESPYTHPSTPEDSIATPVATGGEVDIMAEGLQAAGFFCAQARANPTATQIWCRTVETGLTIPDQLLSVTTVDVVTTPTGQIGYLRISLPNTRMRVGSWDADTRLNEILSASVLRIWPDDTNEVQAAIATVRDYGYSPGQSSHDPRTPRRATTHTQHAEYFVGEGTSFDPGATTSEDQPLTFIAATDQLPDTWPSSSAHSLTTAAAAAPGLEAGGFTCYGEHKTSCYRVGGNRSVDYSTALGSADVVTVSVVIGGGTDDNGRFSTLADQGFPRGLTFLTDAVRRGVETRLNQARHDGTSFAGIIDGAIVVIDTSPSTGPPDPSSAQPVTLTVGAPLITGVSAN